MFFCSLAITKIQLFIEKLLFLPYYFGVGNFSKVTELWKDGRIVVTKHTEARPSSEVPKVTKGFCIGDSKGLYSYSKFSALVQGYDFEINELGEIKRLR